MILEALVAEVSTTFAREKRAQVCLWFDEKREFHRLLPALRGSLDLAAPRPFELLEYDLAAGQGQLWLKAQVHWAGRDLPVEERERKRFLLYLPVAHERVLGPDGPEEGGDPRRAPWLEFLHEYEFAGLRFRVDGRDPSLFGFLRKAGANLPADPREQRLLWQGGRDSLIARLSEKWAHADRQLWSIALTAATAQDKILGDVELELFAWASSPAETVAGLMRRGLLDDLVDRVHDRFGLVPSEEHDAGSDPAGWIGAFVEHLALCEVFEEFGRPKDFPHASRVPELQARLESVSFLRRWLRDADARGDYERLIRERESGLNLSAWSQTKGEEGGTRRPFSLPGLTQDRWRAFAQHFVAAATKQPELSTLLADSAEVLDLESTFSRASPWPVRGWDLVRRLGELSAACKETMGELASCADAAAVARIYVRFSERCDLAHWRLLADARREDGEDDVVAALVGAADRIYGDYVRVLNDRFFERFREQDDSGLPGFSDMAARMEGVWTGSRPCAVIIVDALRYDCGAEIARKLQLPTEDPRAGIVAARALIPTVTSIGMTAMVPGVGPGKASALRVEVASKALRIRVLSGPAAGKDLAARQNRLDLFRTAPGTTCVEIKELEGAGALKKAGKDDVLVVFGHEALDEIGHGDADTLIRHLDEEIARIVRVVRKLHRGGFRTVYIVTDHGFLFVDETSMTELPPADRARVEAAASIFKERFALVDPIVPVPVKTMPCSLDATVRVALPPSTSFFRAEKTFTHGGASVQELIVPFITARAESAAPRIQVKPELASYEVKVPPYTVKVPLRVEAEPAELFSKPIGRTVRVDLRKGGTTVLGRPWERALPPPPSPSAPEARVSAVLMLSDRAPLANGDTLDLVITDVETGERLSPAGLKLTVLKTD